jgi:hypothetical protein
MSELLGTLATCLPTAAEASQRLRTYVQEIDGFLGPTQTPGPGPLEGTQSYGDENGGQQSHTTETMVPLELLQGISWDWPENLQPSAYTHYS